MAMAQPATVTEPSRNSPLVVKTLTRDMVRAFLEAEDYQYFTDSDGDFLVEFGYDRNTGGAMLVRIDIETSRGTLLAVTVECDRYFAIERRFELLSLINEYHGRFRWPKVCLHEDEDEEIAYIVCELHVDLSMGVHGRLLHELVDSAISDGFAFWRWLKRRLDGEPGMKVLQPDDDEADIETASAPSTEAMDLEDAPF